jgi:hypothetical protein
MRYALIRHEQWAAFMAETFTCSKLREGPQSPRTVRCPKESPPIGIHAGARAVLRLFGGNDTGRSDTAPFTTDSRQQTR